MARFVLALDQGTTSSRSILFRRKDGDYAVIEPDVSISVSDS